MWIRLIVLLSLLKGSFSLFDTYLVIFGLFLPQKKIKKKLKKKIRRTKLMSKCG